METMQTLDTQYSAPGITSGPKIGIGTPGDLQPSKHEDSGQGDFLRGGPLEAPEMGDRHGEDQGIGDDVGDGVADDVGVGVDVAGCGDGLIPEPVNGFTLEDRDEDLLDVQTLSAPSPRSFGFSEEVWVGTYECRPPCCDHPRQHPRLNPHGPGGKDAPIKSQDGELHGDDDQVVEDLDDEESFQKINETVGAEDPDVAAEAVCEHWVCPSGSESRLRRDNTS